MDNAPHGPDNRTCHLLWTGGLSESTRRLKATLRLMAYAQRKGHEISVQSYAQGQGPSNITFVHIIRKGEAT